MPKFHTVPLPKFRLFWDNIVNFWNACGDSIPNADGFVVIIELDNALLVGNLNKCYDKSLSNWQRQTVCAETLHFVLKLRKCNYYSDLRSSIGQLLMIWKRLRKQLFLHAIIVSNNYLSSMFFAAEHTTKMNSYINCAITHCVVYYSWQCISHNSIKHHPIVVSRLLLYLTQS